MKKLSCLIQSFYNSELSWFKKINEKNVSIFSFVLQGLIFSKSLFKDDNVTRKSYRLFYPSPPTTILKFMGILPMGVSMFYTCTYSFNDRFSYINSIEMYYPSLTFFHLKVWDFISMFIHFNCYDFTVWNHIGDLFATFLHELAKVFCKGPDSKSFRLRRTHVGFYRICILNNPLNVVCRGPQDYLLVQ